MALAGFVCGWYDLDPERVDSSGNGRPTVEVVG
jgi:hypothetical protein